MESFQVQIEKFSGPLGLLLELIEQRNLDITEISISQVTNDYMSFLNTNTISSNEMADFLVIASTLLLIKSKAILPTLSLSGEEEEEIIDLKDRLALYKFFKDKALFIKEKALSDTRFFDHEPFINESIRFSPPKDLNVLILRNAFLKALEIYKQENIVYPSKKIKIMVNLKERIHQLLSHFTKGNKYAFSDLVQSKENKIDVIVNFLAILHLAKEGVIGLKQNKNFSNIDIDAN
jgi:segregation and condensation protein A